MFIWGGYHFTRQLLLFGGTTTITQPGFIHPGLTLTMNFHAGLMGRIGLLMAFEWGLNGKKITIVIVGCVALQRLIPEDG